MIIIDNALQKRAEAGNPVKVAMIGAGFMGRGIANQIANSVPGMELVAISNRNVDAAKRAYTEAGIEDIQEISNVADLEDAVKKGEYAVTEDAMLLCRAEGIDAIIEVTGAIEFGAHVVMEAINHRKHIIMMNAELDGTIGSILKVYADK
ncbi:MAG: Gfo/Idh/MocA family oxidoreductase, partial [Cyanobacteria bacterium J06629_18]